MTNCIQILHNGDNIKYTAFLRNLRIDSINDVAPIIDLMVKFEILNDFIIIPGVKQKVNKYGYVIRKHTPILNRRILSEAIRFGALNCVRYILKVVR